MDNKAAHKRHQEKARKCVEDAKNLLGAGWAHVSVEVRWGLVCAGIVALHEAQDEGISAESVRNMISAVTEFARGMIF